MNACRRLILLGILVCVSGPFGAGCGPINPFDLFGLSQGDVTLQDIQDIQSNPALSDEEARLLALQEELE